MDRIIAVFLVLIFLFCIVGGAIAGQGKPISCYKWSYNHLDGFVADRGNFLQDLHVKKQAGRNQNIMHHGLEINRQLFFSHKKNPG